MKMKQRKIFTTLTLLLIWITAFAQAPDMYPPTVPEPVEKPVLYIAATIAVIATYLIYRYTQNRKRNKKNQNNKL